MCKQYSSVRPSDDTTAPSVRTESGQLQKKLRYVRKEGNCNVLFRHVPEEWLLFVADIFTTLVEIRWRVMFLIFALSYILSWLFFGILFWVIALAHGDLKDHTNDPCVYEVRSFTAAFLFSLETQTTIGYGFRGMSENCMVAIIIVTIQDVISCFIDTFVIGIVVAKMASARKRAQTVGFSNSAVINLRDGFLCLSWRVGDFRRHHMVEGMARAQIVRSTLHTTGKVDVTYKDLHIQQSEIVLVTPTIIIHKIEPGSPLHKMSLVDLRKDDFELVVSFTYMDDSTGILHQSRTSYTSAEILWGQVFQDMIRVSRRHYSVDYAMFHHTARVLVPEVSAQEYDRKKRLRPSPRSSPRHSPRSSPKPSPMSLPQQSQQGQNLQPPTVTVELVNDDNPESKIAVTVETSQEDRQQQDSLAPPSDLIP
ncbi:inward rectifier potassium channel 16 [Lampris incognitus]|uniref:inward rectifier potassium channel 16 n=1 Tax=Lampris incognitus TaxID=2546036 RepID=UPI0024B540DE|nr:inward rectifier potassium channel 16 [Lampris incognitus]